MKMAGIQSLTIALCIVLVLSTGVLIGSISLTTSVRLTDKAWRVGDTLVSNARETGNQGVNECLSSSLTDVQRLAGQYLNRVLHSVKSDVVTFLNTPERALLDMVELAKIEDPDVTTSPEWMDGPLRKIMRTRMNGLIQQGTTQLAYYSLPWSRSHPPTSPNPLLAPRGGTLAYFFASFSFGKWPAGTPPPMMMLESRQRPSGLLAFNQTFTDIGEAGPDGHMAFDDGTCDTYVDWTAGEHMGRCMAPAEFLASDSMTHVLDGGLFNLLSPRPQDTMYPKDEVVFSPIVPNFSYLQLFASLTFSHPNMLSITPKQQGRVGMFFTAVEGTGLQKIFETQELPAGSLLYAVDWNKWEKPSKVGTLIAYNGGRLVDIRNVSLPGGSRPFAQAFMMDIRNHTEQQHTNTTRYPPSIIAEHGRYTMALENNYTSAVEMTKSNFLVWKSSNGTVYWTMSVEVNKGALTWFVTLLVPRQSIMDTIDLSQQNILEKNAEALAASAAMRTKEKKEADDERNTSLYMTIGITVGAVLCFMGLAVLLTRKIIAPLHVLASDMAMVALMNLDAVDIHGSLSRLSEVKEMQISFRTMVTNLAEYRNYMPASVFAAQSGDEEEQTDIGTIGTTTTPTTPHKKMNFDGNSIDAGNSMSYSNSDMLSSQQSRGVSINAIHRRRNVLDDGMMKKKQISLISFNMRKWLTVIDAMPSQELAAMHTDAVGLILQSVQSGKGICDIFSGDRIIACFNAYSPVSTHKPQAVKAAHTSYSCFLEASRVAESPALSLSFAVASGEARVGHLGCPGMKKVTTVTSVVPWVVALERYNNVGGYAGCIDGYIAREVKDYYDLMCVDGILFPKRSHSAIKVFELRAARAGRAEEEWMYQLQNADMTAAYKNWNAAFDHVLQDEWDKASISLEKSKDEGVPPVCFQKLTEATRSQSYPRATILYH
eukprot:Rhum_TRINITY_DN8388_c0_g1::Rhum_TRINITY_DN8388_c0_g1_i1::g.27615::m.27615